MTRLQHELGLDRMPEVHEHFDFVGGAGTGGISAAMLSRLRLPIDSAIRHFAKLAEDVFSDKKVFSASGSGAFKSTRMQQALKAMVRDATGDENLGMLEHSPDARKCQTAVFAMSKHNMNAGIPRTFRSYQLATNQVPDCTIWETLSATTAHPDLFKSIDISDGVLTESFVDGGIGCNNPLAHVLAEVKLVYPSRHVGCIISVGAGHAGTIHIPNFNILQRLLPTTAIQAMKAIASDSERVSQEMAVRFSDAADTYFRFNVDQGMQSVKIDEWERLGEVTAHTRGYMQLPVVSERIGEAIQGVKNKRRAISVIHIDGRARTAARQQTAYCGIKSCPQPTSIFVGREQQVQQAAAYLSGDPTKRKVFVIHGLGGAGKTQMALRVIETTFKYWSDIVYTDATTTETVETTLRDFARLKCIGDTYQDTLKWLASDTRRWLLVLDNADDPSINIVKYLPECRHGSILVTTRNTRLLDLAPKPEAWCKLSSMEPDEAQQLLLNCSRRDADELDAQELHASSALLESFSHLPLAIVQAGGYINTQQCSFAQYRELYLEQPEKMLQHVGVRMQLDKYERTIFNAWILSYELLSELAKRLLWVASFMQRDRITMDIFRRAAIHIGNFKPVAPLPDPELELYGNIKLFLGSFKTPSGTWACDAFLGVMGEILSYSLIEYNQMTQTYTLHPLVQTWARNIDPQALQSSDGYLYTAYIVAASINWKDDTADHSHLRSLQLHIATAFERELNISADLLACIARVCVTNGRWSTALPLQGKVVEARRRELGDDHEETMSAMQCFATTVLFQGHLTEAERLWVELAEKTRRVLGDEHPRTLSAMNNLASTYSGQGRMKEAERMRVKVVDARKRVLGDEHPDTLTAMNNLATTYSDQGRTKEAEGLRVHVLDARKRVLGGEHPDILTAMSNLATTYSGQGRMKEAERMRAQVLDASKRVLGNEHPDTLSAMNNLATTYSDQGRTKEAEELRVHVLDASKRVLGDEHPHTLTAMNNLANTYSDQGQMKEAKGMRVKVVDARKRVLGDEHPHTLYAMSNLAITYSDEGRMKQAEELQVHVLDTSKRVLGDEHPHTLTAMSNLATTYFGQGQMKEAEGMRVQVVDARKRVLGDEHPHTLSAMNNLATTYSRQGRTKQAEVLQVQVLDVRKRVLGEEHPDTLIAMNNLAITYSDQGRMKQAEELEVRVLEARKQILGLRHPDTIQSMRNLAITYKTLGWRYRSQRKSLEREIAQLEADRSPTL